LTFARPDARDAVNRHDTKIIDRQRRLAGESLDGAPLMTGGIARRRCRRTASNQDREPAPKGDAPDSSF
jgi:hypothetical protein